MKPAVADLRLLPAAVAAWLGAGIAVAAPGSGWTLAVAIGLWTLAGGLAAARLPGSWRGLVVLALAGGALAVTSVAGQSGIRSPPVLSEAAHAGAARVGSRSRTHARRLGSTEVRAPRHPELCEWVSPWSRC